MNDQQAETVDIGDKTYQMADLSNEVKELLSLHTQAQEMMISARRQAVIHELSASSLATLIKNKVAADDGLEPPQSEAVGHVVQ